MNQRLTMADVPVALLAGGRATRLGALAEQIPKAMVPVAGRPFIDHQLAMLHRQGAVRVVLCLGHLGEQVRSHVGDGRRWGLRVDFVFDGPRLLGTGGALRRAEPLLADVSWVMYGDSYLDFDFGAVLGEFAASKAEAMMTVLANDGRWDRSNVLFRNGVLVRYDKAAPTPDMRHIDYGAALLRRSALLRLPANEPSDLADLYHDLAAEGRLAGYLVQRRFYEIGTPKGLAETEAYLSANAAASETVS